MFSNSRQFVIMGGTFVAQNPPRVQRVHNLNRLLCKVATNAFHNSRTRFDHPRCHPDTRKAILKRLHGWICGFDKPSTPIVWLYGPAGAGKSAILQTLAEQCAKSGLLLASFFFSMSDPTINHPHAFVATIAYQIALRIPDLQDILYREMEHDPFIFQKSIDDQIQSLIVRPLNALAMTGFFDDRTAAPRLIIVDGLDECDKALRGHLLFSIATTLINHHIPLIFLIASRPEQDITHTFNSLPMVGLLWDSLVLDNTYEPDQDIRHFLEDSFTDIKYTHPHRNAIPPNWPGVSTIDLLVRKSSGQFIYAAIVIKYISELSDIPSRRLDVIMGLRAPKYDLPFAEIDAVYKHILSALHDPRTALDILSLQLYWGSFLATVEALLGLEDGDVSLVLAPLSSIVTLKQDNKLFDGRCFIHITHASFSDFLRDKTRSGSFHIDLGFDWQVRMARRSVKLLNSNLLSSKPHKPDPSHLDLTRVILFFLTDLIREPNVLATLYQELYKLRLDIILTHGMGGRVSALAYFIWSLKDQQPLYEKHLRSLKPMLSHHMEAYLSDHNLTTLMIVCLTIYQVHRHGGFNEYDIMALLTMPPHLVHLDVCSFNFAWLSESCCGILTDFLFNSTGCLSLRREHFNTTTLKILHYLCQPRRVSSHQNRLPVSFWSFSTTHRTELGRRRPHEIKPRLLRTRKLQHGIDNQHKLSSGSSSRFGPCKSGFIVLPELLRKCGRSEKLIAFIYQSMKDIAIMQQWTRSACGALLGYLARMDSGVCIEEEVEVAYYDPNWSP